MCKDGCNEPFSNVMNILYIKDMEKVAVNRYWYDIYEDSFNEQLSAPLLTENVFRFGRRMIIALSLREWKQWI